MEPTDHPTNKPSLLDVDVEKECSEQNVIRFIGYSGASGAIVLSELDDNEAQEVVDGCKFCLCEAYEDGSVFENTCEIINDELSDTLAAAMLNGCDNLDVKLYDFCSYRL